MDLLIFCVFMLIKTWPHVHNHFTHEYEKHGSVCLLKVQINKINVAFLLMLVNRLLVARVF